ncbi:hypothetical protein [Mesomycoplasma conjunctivae]|uniref:hypothetical protein n=1 Tax=Mesomycoplasma conjunctivae TaxID=45361 RepID=UPI003DA42D9A
MNSQQKIQGKNPFSSANNGKIFGFLVGVSWTLVAIFLLLHDQSFRLRVVGLSTILDSLRISVSISFIFESIAFIWAFFVVISFKKVNLIKKAFTNKNVLWLIFGSIFGGPFGSVTYILGIHYTSPGLKVDAFSKQKNRLFSDYDLFLEHKQQNGEWVPIHNLTGKSANLNIELIQYTATKDGNYRLRVKQYSSALFNNSIDDNLALSFTINN